MAMEDAELVLDGFVEAVFRLIIDHHHRLVGELDLTLAQAQALLILGQAPLSTSKLATGLRISAPAVTQLTDRLARKQLIERQPVDGDRRMVLLSLTIRGKGLVDGFRRRRNEAFAGALSHLEEADSVEVIDALKKISWALQAESSGEAPSQPAEARPPEHPAAASNVTAGARLVAVAKRIRMEWD